VLFIDLDGFKLVNDVHGHAVGDAVLSAAAQRLAELVEPPNSPYRIGGVEFVVVTPAVSESDGQPTLLGRITTELSEPYRTATTPVRLAASVGYAQGIVDDVESLLRAADAEMYRHKSRRR
jgi:diguanylate cyclase (GGDEF)-like protein